MRRALALLLVVAAGCGGSSSSSPDGGGGGDDGGGGSGDGGGNSGGSHTVTLTLNNRPMNGAMYSFFVAYQDGSAPWQVAPAPTGDTYSFTVSAPVYGVAYGCIGNTVGTTSTQVRSITSAFFAVGERTDLTFDVPARCTDRNMMGVTLSGTVTNRPTNGLLIVQFGGRTAYVGSQTGNFMLQTPPGTHDLVIEHAVLLGNGEFYVDEAVVERDVAVTAPTQKTIDFNAESQTTQFYNVSVDAFNARVLATTTLYTANATGIGLVRESTNFETTSLSPDQSRATDVYDQLISVSSVGANATVTHATSDPTDQTFVAPDPLGAPTASVVTKMPYPIVETAWPAYADAVGYAWSAQQQLTSQQCGNNVACQVVWTAYLSPGVTGAMPGFRMPVLSDLAGWKTAFQLASGATVTGGVTAQTSSAGAGDFPPGVPANGTDRTFVTSAFSVNP
jgi:hypothetical protein